ncbi:MAG: 6-phosphofructokinase [Armatimonadetes bacterium]|nr:6-phosphofructokinase [Armatimonadota bacterium]
MSKKNVLLCNGGGPTAVINLTNMGVIEGVINYGQGQRKIYAGLGGTGALIGQHATKDGQRHVARLDDYLADNYDRLLVKNTPSTWIGSGRYKLGSGVPESISGGDKQKALDYDCGRVIEVCDQLDVGHVFFVGGDDTLTTLNALADYAERHPRTEWPTFLSVPKTIDNDLPYGVADPNPDENPVGVIKRGGRIMAIDACPGFGTAANFIANMVAHLAVEARALRRHYVIEVMGRDAGFLTAASLAAKEFGYGPHMIAVPEHGAFDVETFAKLVAERQRTEGWGVYAISEGIRDADGKPLAARGVDAFGNARLGGAADRIADDAKAYSKELKSKADVRTIRPSEMHRICSTYRTEADTEFSYQVGYHAAYWAIERQQTGKLVTIVRNEGRLKSWSYGLVDTKLVAGKQHKREMDDAWVVYEDVNGLSVPTIASSFMDYLNPLLDPILPIAPAYSGDEVEV